MDVNTSTDKHIKKSTLAYKYQDNSNITTAECETKK